MRAAAAPAVLAVAPALLAAVVAGCGGSGAARSSSPGLAVDQRAHGRALHGRAAARRCAGACAPASPAASPTRRRTSSAASCAAARSPGLLWSHDDSGAGPVLFGLRADGRVAARPTVTGAQAVDWEDIAAGPAPDGRPLLYVGDIGDNASRRAVGRRLSRRRSRASAPRPPLPPRACGCATPTAPTMPRRCSSIRCAATS